MTFTFRPAVRENVGLLVGLAGASGSGKTFSALRLAKGLSGGKPFAFIDTEARRGLHYADQFSFEHCDMRPPFSPDAYADAIGVADKAGYPVIVVDSFSHEHAGEGGLLDMQEAELDRMAKDDWKKREACKMASWIKPKVAHKHMVQRLLQVRAHLILCFRAEEKIEMVKEDGKLVVRPKKSTTGLDGWLPVCEKNLPYELTTSFLLVPSAPGVPMPIKLQEQHRQFFPPGKPITEECGVQLAAWARGGATPPAAQRSDPQRSAAPQAALPTESAASGSPWRGVITDTTEATSNGKTVYTVSGEGGVEFKTIDKSLRVMADQLAGQPTVVEYTVTSKGAKQITSIKGGSPGG